MGNWVASLITKNAAAQRKEHIEKYEGFLEELALLRLSSDAWERDGIMRRIVNTYIGTTRSIDVESCGYLNVVS